MLSSSLRLFPLFSPLTCVQLATTPCVVKSLSSRSLLCQFISYVFPLQFLCSLCSTCSLCSLGSCLCSKRFFCSYAVQFFVFFAHPYFLDLPAPRVFCRLPFLFLASLDLYFSFMWKQKRSLLFFFCLFCCLPACLCALLLGPFLWFRPLRWLERRTSGAVNPRDSSDKQHSSPAS